jgi:hypothetical protein
MKNTYKKLFIKFLYLNVLLCFNCSSDSSDEVNQIVLVSSITILGDSITDGTSSQLSVQVLPANADNNMVSWSVSDMTVAVISESGLLTAVSNGSVIISAIARDASGISAQRTFTISGVENPIEGTIVETSQQLLAAVANATPGETIYIRGGNYVFNSPINFNNNGSNGNMISLMAYPEDGDRPKFDFSSMSESSSNRGIQLNGNYWHVKGIDVYGAGDNGMFIRGSHNLIEFCTFSFNRDTGLQIGNGGSHNVILNCDSFFNADSSIENADGFACKLDAGDENKFIGCRAWQNLDDGWDGYLRGTDNITTYYEQCWAFKNGYLADGTVSGGDGNGFKTGGSDNKDLKHNTIFKNCIAAGNLVDGFDHNSNRGDIEIFNSAAFQNGRNINFGSTNRANLLRIKNTVSFASVNGNDSFSATTTDINFNGWQAGLITNNNDFVSVDIELLAAPRNPDGSLPNINFLKLVSGSDLIDAGVDVGLPFIGGAPDVNVFEFEQ